MILSKKPINQTTPKPPTAPWCTGGRHAREFDGMSRWALVAPVLAACGGQISTAPSDAGPGGSDVTTNVPPSDGGDEATFDARHGTDASVDDASTYGTDAGHDDASIPSICTPGASRCSGSAVQTCGATGQWGAAQPCSQPTPECNAGTCTCTQSLCSGQCVNLQTDNANCGGCGLGCATGCTAGECVTIVGAAPTTPKNSVGLALYGPNVYWATFSGIFAGSRDGGPATNVAPGPTMFVAVGGSNLYWTDGQATVVQVPQQGGNAITIFSDNNWDFLTGIAADDSNVYWSNGGTILQAAAGGGTVVTLVNGTGSCDYGLVVDDANVYCPTLPPGAVVQIPKGGGTPVTLGTETDGGEYSQGEYYGGGTLGIALDGANAYLADFATFPAGAGEVTVGAILEIPLDGGATTTLATESEPPNAIAVDQQNVYWWNQALGTIKRVPKTGGAPVTLYAGQVTAGPAVLGMAVDDTSVYWLMYNRIGVMKLTPK
jgi:hypothetical protein